MYQRLDCVLIPAEFTDLPTHEITRGVNPFSIRDEWYFNTRFRPDLWRQVWNLPFAGTLETCRHRFVRYLNGKEGGRFGSEPR